MSVCATCLQPGLPANGHDCPGLGEVQVTRQRGCGVVVDHAPQRALIGLRIVRDLAWPGNIAEVGDPDLVNIADQVLYRVAGYDSGTASLIADLVEDWRPDPAARVRSLPERELHDTIRKMARVDPAWFRTTAQAMDRIGQAANVHAVFGSGQAAREPEGVDVAACTPIPAETLTRMSGVPPELLTEQQLGRAENALERLRIAREALIRDGYFTADEVGPDIGPRIVEWLSHHRGLIEELNAEVARLRAGEEPGWDPLVVPTPGQWIARWNSLGPAERLGQAQGVIGASETANRCHFEGHALKIEKGREALVALARVRDLRDSWLLMTLEPGQVRRLLDGITRALDGSEEAGAAERASGFVPARTKHWPRGETSGDPLVVEPYRNDQNQDRWVFRCWGTKTCDGWLSLDHYSQESAERARDRHVAEEHGASVPPATEHGTCTATIKSYGGPVLHCAQPAGHYDESRPPEPLVDDDPRGWHRSTPDREGGPMTWADRASDTTPHRTDPTEEKPTPSPKRITIDPPDGPTILASRHLDANEGPVQVGAFVNTATRSAITTVLRYIAKAHNSPNASEEQQ